MFLNAEFENCPGRNSSLNFSLPLFLPCLCNRSVFKWALKLPSKIPKQDFYFFWVHKVPKVQWVGSKKHTGGYFQIKDSHGGGHKKSRVDTVSHDILVVNEYL